MSVLSLNTNVSYISTGTVGPYPFNFPISEAGSLTVIQNAVLLARTAYTVTPVNNNYDNGGSVTLVAAAPAGQSVVLQRLTPLTQISDYTDNMPQPMKQFEASLDKITEILQEIVADETGGGGVQTYVIAGAGVTVTGTGSVSNPYVVSIASGFTITSFTGGQSGEIGQQFITPNFGASYSGSPTSANITNTDSIDSPHNLTAPFTSATIAGTFAHSVPATTTFTLSASNGASTMTANQTITWNERIFGGIGTAGATSTVTASGTSAVLSTTDVLPSAGLGTEVVGQTFGPFTPSGQAVYLLLNGNSHNFIDTVSGFPFAFNAPITVSFTNQYGTVITMFLYQSTNPLTGTFIPKIVS